MKSKLTVPVRGKSNPPLKNLPPSTVLEEETKKMVQDDLSLQSSQEQRLRELKDVMSQEATRRETEGIGNTRWRAADDKLPIKNYAKAVLETKPRAPATMNPKKINKENFSNTVSIQNERTAREKTNLNATTTTSTMQSGRGDSAKKSQRTPQSRSFSNHDSEPENEGFVQKASDNLKKALLTQKNENDQVDLFLKEVGLPQYSAVFKENGFDDLDTIMEIQTKHLVDMKIPAGHQIKLMKQIEKKRQANPEYKKNILPSQASEQSQPNQTAKLENKIAQSTTDRPSSSASNTSSFKKKESEYIDLEGPHEMALGEETGIGVGTESNGGDLLKGNYNEAESNAYFQEALMEWRKGKKPEPVQKVEETKPKRVKFAEDGKDEVEYISSRQIKSQDGNKRPKASFLFGGGGNWAIGEDYPTQKTTGTGTSPKAVSKVKPKISCWHCYKMVPEENSIASETKKFCSEECFKNFKMLNSTTCYKKNCSKQIFKEDGLLHEGRWYCDEKCLPTKEEQLLEEQRLLNKIAKEQEKPLVKKEPEIKKLQEPEPEPEKMEPMVEVDLDLSVQISTKKILTLEELEEKYKKMSTSAAENKAQNSTPSKKQIFQYQIDNPFDYNSLL